MSRRNFADFDAAVLTRLGNRSDATTARREQWINDALLMVANRYVHPELQGIGNEILLNGTDSIIPLVNTDIWWPELVKDLTNGKILDPGSKEEIENIQTKSPGRPARFYWWQKTFFFDHIASADTTIRIWYRKQPIRLASGVSPLNEVYDFLLEQLATMNGLNYFREYEKAHIAETQANNYATEMRLPVFEEKKNDVNARLRLRIRR